MNVKSVVVVGYVIACNYTFYCRKLSELSSDEALVTVFFFLVCLRICRSSFACKRKAREKPLLPRRKLCATRYPDA
jgi:hypothetical protein